MKKPFFQLILAIIFLATLGCNAASESASPEVSNTPTPEKRTLDFGDDDDEGISFKVELPAGSESDDDLLAAALPGKSDIILWLDAVEGVTVNGATLTWTDKINGTQFEVEGQLIAAAINQKPVVRLSGNSGLSFDAGLDRGAYSVFIVNQRTADQTNGPNSQRLLSVWDGTNPTDEYLPSFSETISAGNETSPPSLYVEEIHIGGRTRFSIGQNAVSDGDHFHGDIAEVIVYQKVFVMPEPVDDIQAYLGEKWGVDYVPMMGWTEAAPQSETVSRRNHNYPLSDQNNTGDWTLYEPWSDEFDDGVLETIKWLPHNHEWYGRHPAIFLPENISEGGGTVKLAMKKDTSLPVVDLYSNGLLYENYSSATLQSLTAKRYGYVEIRARAGVGSSAFWLYAETYRDNLHNKLEIDVYEIGGRERGYEELYNMNTWVWVIDGTPIIFETGGKWHAGIPFADEFHVFGFKWTADILEYYVDGVLVRSMPNRHYHSPLILLFDTETMPVWFGVPPDEHLPEFHEIDYVRTWTNAETVDTWEGDYVLMYDPRYNNPTAEYVNQFPGHVDENIPGSASERVFCNLLPTRVEATVNYTFDLEYSTTAGENDLVLEFWLVEDMLAQEIVKLPAESADTATVTIALPTAPPEGFAYQLRASIRPAGTDEVQNRDSCFKNLIIGTQIPVTDLKISPALKSLQLGETWQMLPFIFPPDATDQTIRWQSTNENVVTIDKNGLITAVAEGMATILATAADGDFTAQGAVVITAPQSGLLTNNGFENAELHPWTFYGEVSLDTENMQTGAYGIAVRGNGAVEQLVSVGSNTTYKLSGYGKVAAAGQEVFFGVKAYETDSLEYTDVKITATDFVKETVTFTTGPDNTTARVYFFVRADGQMAFGDNFNLTIVE
jgi:beta-glucanase (GH16 family)